MYGEKEIFWGLGIEEETYFEFTRPIYVATPVVRTAHKAERYSVDYYKTFKSGPLEKAFATMFPDASGFVDMPMLLNSHAFEKMDVNWQHKTTYETKPKPNPKFSGTTFFEALQAWRPAMFKEEYEQSFLFDGDSIEFITQEFYKTNPTAVVKELVQRKTAFLEALNAFLVEKNVHREKGALRYPPRNPGFAIFYSNPLQVAMFNNGTYHINLTLPTLLGPKGDGESVAPLLHPEEFRSQHRRCIRLIQWLEPLLIAAYGSPDPFSAQCPEFAKGSQRCAVSRYIGVGTYDTVAMREGKILTLPVNEIRGCKTDFWWYKRYHATSAYNALDKIGMDINYKKHYNHGIEIRMFDWFPEDRLKDLIKLLVYVCDAALDREEAPEAVLSPTWNDLVVCIFQQGNRWTVAREMCALYERIFGLELTEKLVSPTGLLEAIRLGLKSKYKKKGRCSQLMLKKAA